MKDKYLITHYMPLVAIIIASTLGFVIFSYDKALKIALAISTGISYVVWGLIHHYIHKDLNWDVMIEYLVISIFGVLTIIFLMI